MSKIVMQILSKVGSRIWEVKLDKIIPSKYIPAVAGLSISKEKGNFNFKLVGSINPELSKNTNLNFQSNTLR